MKMKMEEANWSDLPLDVLCLFADRLDCDDDIVSFSEVCASWRFAAAEAKKRHRFSPCLMLARSENDEIVHSESGIRSCWNLSTGKAFNLRLPLLRGRRCWGTQFGWIFTLGLDLDIFLFNPLTGARIPLPSQRNFPPLPMEYYRDRNHLCQIFIDKVALSADPISGRPLTVMVSYGGLRKLAFASPGDQAWRSIESRKPAIQDLTFYKNRFVCIDCQGVYQRCYTDAAMPHTKVVARAPQHKDWNPCHPSYLIQISTKLYLITRVYDQEINPTSRGGMLTQHFNVWRFLSHTHQWGPLLKTLNGYALFLGNNQAFVISPSEYPQVKPDCIYFTDDYCDYYETDFSDMGIYDYKSRTIVDRSFYNCNHQPSKFSRSLVFIPQLS